MKERNHFNKSNQGLYDAAYEHDACGVGMIVNIIVGIALDIILTLIPLLIGFIVYAQFYFSGKAFIETLKKIRE